MKETPKFKSGDVIEYGVIYGLILDHESSSLGNYDNYKIFWFNVKAVKLADVVLVDSFATKVE